MFEDITNDEIRKSLENFAGDVYVKIGKIRLVLGLGLFVACLVGSVFFFAQTSNILRHDKEIARLEVHLAEIQDEMTKEQERFNEDLSELRYEIDSKPVVEIEPEPEVQVDEWEEVRICEPTHVNVLVQRGSDFYAIKTFLKENGYSEFNSERFQAYERTEGWEYEVWQMHVIDEAVEIDEKGSGRFGTDLLPTVNISSLDEVPNGHEVYVYNQNGFLGRGFSSPGANLEYEYNCFEDLVTEIEWATEGELEYLADSVITFTKKEDGIIGGFVSSFYAGEKLSQEEINHLRIDADDSVTNWYTTGFIGGGSSSHGNYGMIWEDEEATLVWGENSYGDRESTPSYTVLKGVPLNREIVVYTVNFWRDGNHMVELQRFVLHGNVDWEIQMLELEEDTPEEIYPTFHHYQSKWNEVTKTFWDQ